MGNDQSQERQKESFKFFWRSDPNPFSSPANATWSPYDEGDNHFLEQQYQMYLKDPKTETILGNPPRYQINFKNWIQINVANRYLQRPIKRELPGNIVNILRFHRFDSNISLSDQPKINCVEEKTIVEKKGMVKIDSQ